MAYTFAENSATVSSTELSLPRNATYSSGSPQTTVGTYQLFLDISAMVGGDQFELTFYEKCVSGGTQRVVSKSTLTGANGTPIAVLPPLILGNGWDITLKKLSTTDRTIAWSIRSI